MNGFVVTFGKVFPRFNNVLALKRKRIEDNDRDSCRSCVKRADSRPGRIGEDLTPLMRGEHFIVPRIIVCSWYASAGEDIMKLRMLWTRRNGWSGVVHLWRLFFDDGLGGMTKYEDSTVVQTERQHM